ncbi:MAG: hypothetical protein ACLQU2_02455 [Candidatus Binataceae bacterium]
MIADDACPKRCGTAVTAAPAAIIALSKSILAVASVPDGFMVPPLFPPLDFFSLRIRRGLQVHAVIVDDRRAATQFRHEASRVNERFEQQRKIDDVVVQRYEAATRA